MVGLNPYRQPSQLLNHMGGNLVAPPRLSSAAVAFPFARRSHQMAAKTSLFMHRLGFVPSLSGMHFRWFPHFFGVRKDWSKHGRGPKVHRCMPKAAKGAQEDTVCGSSCDYAKAVDVVLRALKFRCREECGICIVDMCKHNVARLCS